MAGWNDLSLSRARGVNPDLLRLLGEVRIRSGVPFEIAEGLRDRERQAKMVAEGRSQTYNSRHLDGNALDIYIPDGKGGIVHDFDQYAPLGELAKQIAAQKGYDDFRWGGDWKTLRDGAHFEFNRQPPSLAPSAGLRAAAAAQTSGRQQQAGLTAQPAPPVGGGGSGGGDDGMSWLAQTLSRVFGTPPPSTVASQRGTAGQQAGLEVDGKGPFARGSDGSLNFFGRSYDDAGRRKLAQGLINLGLGIG